MKNSNLFHTVKIENNQKLYCYIIIYILLTNNEKSTKAILFYCNIIHTYLRLVTYQTNIKFMSKFINTQRNIKNKNKKVNIISHYRCLFIGAICFYK